MVMIISEERYLSLVRKHTEQYLYLKEKFPNDKDWKKVKRVLSTLKGLYGRDKVYAVKQMNLLEDRQILFSEERRALIVQLVELLQKLILHKKLQRHQN